MSNLTTGSVSNIIVGPARILIAPIGTTAPSDPSTVTTVTWDAAWKEVGYTQKGVDLTYTPTVKDITVDEEMAAVKQILTAEKASLSAVLSEATLKNLQYAISASLLSTTAASTGVVGFTKFDVGSGALVEHMVGLEGLSPEGLPRVFIGWRGLCVAAVKLAFQRTTETTIPLDINFLADSSKTAGKRLFHMFDIEAPAT